MRSWKRRWPASPHGARIWWKRRRLPARQGLKKYFPLVFVDSRTERRRSTTDHGLLRWDMPDWMKENLRRQPWDSCSPGECFLRALVRDSSAKALLLCTVLLVLINAHQVFTCQKTRVRPAFLCDSFSQRLQQERSRIDAAMRQQHRVATETAVQETMERLGEIEAERDKMVSRVLEAEAEAERQR